MTDDSAESQVKESDSTQQAGDPVRRITKIVLIVVVFLFLWYVLADRLAPWTDQARVQGYVVPIAPKVAGKVVNVNVVQDQVVNAGDLLVQINPGDYELAVQEAEAALEQAGQDIGASTDAVSIAEAKLTEARTQLKYYQQQAKRYLELARTGVISKAEADKTRAEVDKARARALSAQAELDKAKEQLGREGQDNPRIRKAIAALEQARINLSETSLYAPGFGGVTNLRIDEGHWASAGMPLMTFISGSDVWVQANMRENSIGNLKPGDAVDIVMDVAPGRVFSGEVASVGFGVNQPSTGEVGSLATIKADAGWLRDAQRFPVIIKFTDDESAGLRRIGGQADVQIYGDNWILNGLGWLWIRFMSLMSYVY